MRKLHCINSLGQSNNAQRARALQTLGVRGEAAGVAGRGGMGVAGVAAVAAASLLGDGVAATEDAVETEPPLVRLLGEQNAAAVSPGGSGGSPLAVKPPVAGLLAPVAAAACASPFLFLCGDCGGATTSLLLMSHTCATALSTRMRL